MKATLRKQASNPKRPASKPALPKTGDGKLHTTPAGAAGRRRKPSLSRIASAPKAGRAPDRGLLISIPRLFLYHRALEDATKDGDAVLTSDDLAGRVGRGISATQIRKDLSYLGSFGRRGRGYHVASLVQQLAKVLGLNRDWRIAIAGFGYLGHALASFLEYREEKFRIVAIFDTAPDLVGTSWHGVTVRHIDDVNETLAELDCGIGIVAVPAAAAQVVGERLVAAGIGAILNFAPTTLRLTSSVAVRTIDLASELSILTHHLA
ncbi:MAG: redox-sensing transcriptional repressor Rex [Candidatus Eremiobacter antarcticus]|nr:redox-sensing transcriptional repressor Rex [Candidatus Eremiobacteraeota bacterium]MBC5807996.1 redox-sensing transcriptional repressor Rex [Candidatus Eremiobacteraeota bacterium]PZR62644.1 MAG: redox-sensing transcriptional repressor Rex [Candidatus Eremiobacter sp. RRmetagenome_bin22]